MYCRTEPSHPKRNSKGLYPLHRVVLENKLGRILTKEEHAHHKNGDKNDNREENLEVLTVSEHSKFHKTSEKIKYKCDCGNYFYVKPHVLKLRVLRNKCGKIFCSRSCGAKFSKLK